MCSKLRTFVFGILFFVFVLDSYATAPVANSGLSFERNKAQWPSQVLFKADIPSGRMFLERNKLTFVYHNTEDLEKCHKIHEAESSEEIIAAASTKIRCHSFKVNFLGSSEATKVNGEQIKEEYRNYFIGNDKSKWASNVEVFDGVRYSKIYPSIDLSVYSYNGMPKYDFILNANADLRNISLSYEGVNCLAIEDGNLKVITSVNEIIEQKPNAYQEVNGQTIEFRSKYKLKGNIVSFEILSSYDRTIPLIIDPLITAATYLGSTSTVLGCCATYDSQGNIYGGGVSYGNGYPVTIGAFDVSFNSITDISICKLNPTGSSLLYSTFLGGEWVEWPQSLIVNSDNELCIFGATGSIDFPTSSGCYDNSLNGGRDIVISHLNEFGSLLLGSTFIGGDDADGCLDSARFGGGIRPTGEIITDSSGNIYAVSLSLSSNFPITPGARSHVAGEDVVVFKLNADCSNLLWSTCIGGTDNDRGSGIRSLKLGDIVITGSTNSLDFPSTPGAYHTSYQGGTNDGFITRISPFSNSIVSSSFYGTDVDDKSSLIDIDSSDNVYIYGQTLGNIPIITANTFGVAGSRNFIAKLNPLLSTLVFQTVIGNMTGIGKRLTPTAFCVDTCENIYLSGYYNAGNTLVDFDFPITSNAFYADPYILTTNNVGYGAFYFAQLSANASSLKFGTFFPGGHVDGGLSRFDKVGNMYQAICMIRGIDVAPTLPNSFSLAMPGGGNDLYLLKVDFQSLANANAAVSPADSGCSPFHASFSSGFSNGKKFTWNFGDGTALDTARNPTHTFSDTGNFQVQLIAYDSTLCVVADTTYLNIYVAPELVQQVVVDTILCNVPSMNLQAHDTTSGNNYQWSTNAATSYITINRADTFWVDISNKGCAVRDTFIVDKLAPPDLGPDTNLCTGQIILLEPQVIGESYLWSSGDTTSTIQINSAAIYWVDAYKQACTLRDSISVGFIDYPIVNLGRDTTFCPYNLPVMNLDAGNLQSSHHWSTGDTTTLIQTSSEGDYWVEVGNAQCKASDTIHVSVSLPIIQPQEEVSFCDPSDAVLDAKISGVDLLWNTGDTTLRIQVFKSGLYWYQISYANCLETDSIDVTITNSGLWIPNAFTPNGDGKNDVFLPVGNDIQEMNMEIYNRWGQHLFTSKSLQSGWDGTVNGNLVQPGVYNYRLSYLMGCSGEYFYKDGYVLVME